MSKLMTLEELAEYLRFNKKTIYRLLRQDNIPSMKIGNKWRFNKELIDKWVLEGIEGVKAHILVIDDDEVIGLLFKRTLEQQGHQVIIAPTGTEGMLCMKESDFDLVFLDLYLPDIDGADVLRELRRIKPDLPVNIVTGYPDSGSMQRVIEQGHFAVLVKPLDGPDIIAAVNSFLYVSRKRK